MRKKLSLAMFIIACLMLTYTTISYESVNVEKSKEIIELNEYQEHKLDIMIYRIE